MGKVTHQADSIYVSEHICLVQGHAIEVWIDGDKQVILCVKCGLTQAEIHAGEIGD